MCQCMRDSDEPFLLPREERPAPPTLAFRVVTDHSMSMNYGKEWSTLPRRPCSYI